jgi:hypothetical protein
MRHYFILLAEVYSYLEIGVAMFLKKKFCIAMKNISEFCTNRRVKLEF